MSNFLEALVAIGFLVATAISVWVIVLEPVYQDAAIVSSSMVAAQQPDLRLNPARS